MNAAVAPFVLLLVAGCTGPQLTLEPMPADLAMTASEALDMAVGAGAGLDLAAAAPDLARSPSLEFGNDVAAGGAPMAIAVGDFNRDDRLDLISTTTTAVYLHQAGPPLLFGPPVKIADVFNGRGTTVADMDGDMLADVLVADSTSPAGVGAVVILRSLGNYGFAPWARVTPSAIANPMTIAVADFDGDHVNDFAVHDLRNAAVLFGRGDGSFIEVDLPTNQAEELTALTAGDLDSDGRPDIVALGDPGAIRYWRNLGGRTFSGATGLGGNGFASVQAPNAITLADVNRDGRVDIVATDIDGAQILLAKPDGGFANGVIVSTCAGAVGVATADFDRDQNLDVAVACWSGPQPQATFVLHGHGDGTFAAPIALDSAGGNETGIVAADLDRDGRPDLVVGETWANLLRVYVDR